MALNISRRGLLYCKAESSYADTGVTFASSDAMRHIDFGAEYDGYNRVSSSEKKVAPADGVRFDRRTTSSFDIRSMLLRPSGTLNTLPEADELLMSAIGAKTNVTLATTVSSGGTATGAVVASAGTLAVGDAVLLTRAGVRYVRILTNVAGTTLTWAPALPSSITTGESVKGCITYKLASALSQSLALFHILPGFRRLILGAVPDKFTVKFDANEEVMLAVSGPAQRQSTTGLPSTPAAFTTVGGNPPSGLLGDLYINDAAYLYKHLEMELTNNFRLRNSEVGNGGLASEAYRFRDRDINFSLDAFAETEATLYDLAEAGSTPSIFAQMGRTEGNIVGLYMPKTEPKVPPTTDGDEEADWAFKGKVLESSLDAANEFTLVLA